MEIYAQVNDFTQVGLCFMTGAENLNSVSSCKMCKIKVKCWFTCSHCAVLVGGLYLKDRGENSMNTRNKAGFYFD